MKITTPEERTMARMTLAAVMVIADVAARGLRPAVANVESYAQLRAQRIEDALQMADAMLEAGDKLDAAARASRDPPGTV